MAGGFRAPLFLLGIAERAAEIVRSPTVTIPQLLTWGA
jgi:hypothetical protein